LDLSASLEPFRRSGDDLIDRWDGSRLLRTLPTAHGHIAYRATLAGSIDAPTLDLTVEDASARQAVEQGVRASFVAAPPDFSSLLQRDAVLATLDRLYPGLRPVLTLDLFGALVRAISAQQVNLRWAVTTRRRLAEAFGDAHTVAGETLYSLNPARLAAAGVTEIRALQFTTRKAEYIISAAEAVASGRLSLAELRALPDDEVIARLVAVRGIGLWTAEWLLSRVLGRPRVVAGDLAVRKAVGLAYLGEALPLEADVRRATAHWGDSAEVAQILVLHGLTEGTLQAP